MAPNTRSIPLVNGASSSSNNIDVDDTVRQAIGEIVDEKLASIQQVLADLCEQFFVLDQVTNAEKVNFISIHLYDKAFLWHIWHCYGNKKKSVEPTNEVSNSNAFDVLNTVDNDTELGTNGGTSNSGNKGVNSSGSSFWNVENSSTSTTPIIDKIANYENLIIDGQDILMDDVERVGFGTQSLLGQWRDSYRNGDYDDDPYDDDMYEGQDLPEELQTICDNLYIRVRGHVLARFGSVFDDPMAELKNLKYETSAKIYEDAFDTLLSRVEINENCVVSLFMGGRGLPTKIEMRVRQFKPKTLADAYCLTNLQEATLNAVKKKNRMIHKCSGQIYSLEVLAIDDDETQDTGIECLGEENLEELEEMPHISLNAMNGVQKSRTMRVKGTGTKIQTYSITSKTRIKITSKQDFKRNSTRDTSKSAINHQTIPLSLHLKMILENVNNNVGELVEPVKNSDQEELHHSKSFQNSKRMREAEPIPPAVILETCTGKVTIHLDETLDRSFLYENFKREKAYKAVPPPTGTIIPPRANVSFTGIDELAIRNKVNNQEKIKSSQPEIDRNKVIIEDWVDSDDEETVLNSSETQKKTVLNSENSETSFKNRSPSSQNSVGQGSRKKGLGNNGGKLCFVCYSPNHLIKDCNLHERNFKQTQTHKPKRMQGSRDTRPVWNNINRVNHSNFSGNSRYPHQKRSFIPSAVLTREGLKSTARPKYCNCSFSLRPKMTQTVPSKRTANVFYQEDLASQAIHHHQGLLPQGLLYRTQRPKKIVKSIWVKKGSTVESQAVLPQNVSIKRSAMITSKQTWRQNRGYLDSVNRDNGSYILNTQGNPEEDLKDYAIIDSGCSGSMTGDKNNLSDSRLQRLN
ncbi:hypothetical protein Tco_1015834 [Tanacetum coccineum]|uniref:Uncharacterized protein n=1 Tax=Tanacetum coccineum TaxID=301880 RepID=A0ABQ5FN02_9ASTR